jgi:hypothetical protein
MKGTVWRVGLMGADKSRIRARGRRVLAGLAERPAVVGLDVDQVAEEIARRLEAAA